MSEKTVIDNNNGQLIEGYFERMYKVLNSFLSQTQNVEGMKEVVSILKNSKKANSTIYLIGNGGSAAIAEHTAIDLTKNVGLCSMTISGSPMLTTFSNDYGYQRVFQKALESFAKANDILIAIGSSGKSKNILNACTFARENGLKIITLSGFSAKNPLRKMGDINFWLNSKSWGYVEILHNLLLHYICDSIIGSEIYMIR